MISAARYSRRVLCSLLVAGSLAVGGEALAAPPKSAAAASAATFVDLGSAATYSILGGTGVTNTGAGTVLAGDLGLSPSGAISGFPPGEVRGEIHDKDAAAEKAQEDRGEAYAAAATQPSTTEFAGDQAGVTFHPGVHATAAAFSNTGTMTLDADGDANAVFIFQVSAALSSAAGSKVVLTDGALSNNVFWQVAGAISLGAGAEYVGTFLGAGAIALGEGASLKGRALTPTSVAVANSPFTPARDDLTAPLVTIDGGAERATNDTTPTISGTTDEPAGRAVAVTVAGQSLTATVGAGGAWAVSTTALDSGSHAVTASVTDASQNVGTAEQTLTVDVAAPAIEIAGGATAATKDTTPQISGTTDAAAGTPVTVTVEGQTLASTADADGGWSVTSALLTEAAHSVVASVGDGAGNRSSASQVLTVDTTVPVVTVDGGATRSTVDTSPWTYGTTAERAGTTVHVTIGGQHLTATVERGGTWGVSAAALSVGSYDLVASVTDAAENTGTATQTLTITGPDGPDGPGPTYRPDASVRLPGSSFVGVGDFGPGQRVTKRLRSARSATFQVRVSNRGEASERVDVLGTARNRKFKVRYAANGTNVTRAVVAGTYRTGALAPGKSASLVVTVTRTAVARRGDRRTFAVRADSTHSRQRDTVAAVVIR